MSRPSFVKQEEKEMAPLLPGGWTVHTSRSNPSRKYYFNKETGESVWEISKIPSSSANKNPIQRRLKRTNQVSPDKKAEASKSTPPHRKQRAESRNNSSKQTSSKLSEEGWKTDNLGTKDRKISKARLNKGTVKTPSPLNSSSGKKNLKSAISSPAVSSLVNPVKTVKSVSPQILEKVEKSRKTGCKTDLVSDILNLSAKDDFLAKINKKPSTAAAEEHKLKQQEQQQQQQHQQQQQQVELEQQQRLQQEQIQKQQRQIEQLQQQLKQQTEALEQQKQERILKEQQQHHKLLQHEQEEQQQQQQQLLDYGCVDNSPATPTMEWEDIDIEEVIQVTNQARWDVANSGQNTVDGFDLDDNSNFAFPDDQTPVDKIMVVDTNVYIRDLSLVMAIRDNCVLAVPWTVIQELDGLKGNPEDRVAGPARRSNRWIRDLVRDRELQEEEGFPPTLFQKGSEAEAMAAGADINADERILRYAIHLRDLYAVKVFLVTDDTNLAAKAGIEELESLSADEAAQIINEDEEEASDPDESSISVNESILSSSIQPLKPSSSSSWPTKDARLSSQSPCPTEPFDETACLSTSTFTSDSSRHNSRSGNIFEERISGRQDRQTSVQPWRRKKKGEREQDLEQEADGQESKLVSLVNDFLSSLLVCELEDSYGKVWQHMIKIKPKSTKPFWSFRDLFACYKTYQKAVFGLNFPKSFMDVIDRIRSCVTSKSGSVYLEKEARELAKIVLDRRKTKVGKDVAKLFLNDLDTNLDNQEDNAGDSLPVVQEQVVDNSDPNAVAAGHRAGDRLEPDNNSLLDEDDVNMVELGRQNSDNGAVLIAFTHVWHMLAVVSEGLCKGLGVVWEGESAHPPYNFNNKSANSFFDNFFAYFKKIGFYYEACLLGGRGRDEENLLALCQLMNNIKTDLDIRDLGVWEKTPQVSPDQLKAFFDQAGEQAGRGLEQLRIYNSNLLRASATH